jgi:flagellar export protein FliJ
MPFRYRLQPVLRLHSSLEHQEEQRLLALTSVVNRLRAELEMRQGQDFAARRAALADMEVFSSGAQLQFRAWCEAAAQRTIELLKRQLQEAERKRLEQLKVYQDARQRREIFEGLRERQKEIYDHEWARREQQSTDEAFLVRAFGASQD